jgi:hypothetical protein
MHVAHQHCRAGLRPSLFRAPHPSSRIPKSPPLVQLPPATAPLIPPSSTPPPPSRPLFPQSTAPFYQPTVVLPASTPPRLLSRPRAITAPLPLFTSPVLPHAAPLQLSVSPMLTNRQACVLNRTQLTSLTSPCPSTAWLLTGTVKPKAVKLSQAQALPAWHGWTGLSCPSWPRFEHSRRVRPSLGLIVLLSPPVGSSLHNMATTETLRLVTVVAAHFSTVFIRPSSPCQRRSRRIDGYRREAAPLRPVVKRQRVTRRQSQIHRLPKRRLALPNPSSSRFRPRRPKILCSHRRRRCLLPSLRRWGPRALGGVAVDTR